MVIADLDMQNFFNSIEWAAIRSSVRRHFEDAAPFVEWEQQHEGLSFLSDGGSFRFNRGAEQGETFGPIKSALPIMDARNGAWSLDILAFIIEQHTVASAASSLLNCPFAASALEHHTVRCFSLVTPPARCLIVGEPVRPLHHRC